MRVNVYAEEMTDRVEIIAKEIENQPFTGLRFYLELPATIGGQQHRGPFLHRSGDDDSSAVTFWGKRDLRTTLRKALGLLDAHYDCGASNMSTLPPAIGAEWRGGIYAGRSLHENEPVDLVLLPGEFTGNWTSAGKWAKDQGGELPLRIDLFVLWMNARALFAKEWYWSCEQCTGDAQSAWSQNFGYGLQDASRKNNELRARAVRRVKI